MEVKVLCVHWWSEGADSLERCSPQTWNHVYGKCQRDHTDEELWHVGAVVRIVVWEFEPTKEVDAQQAEDNYPQAEEHLAVEYMPTVSKVSYGEELQSKCKFNKAKYHLYNVHPTSRLWSRLKKAWKHGEEGEWDGKCYGEAEHAYGWCQYAALCRYSNKQKSDNGSCA